MSIRTGPLAPEQSPQRTPGVTYTEYDDEGNSQGNVEYPWKVEQGES